MIACDRAVARPGFETRRRQRLEGEHPLTVIESLSIPPCADIRRLTEPQATAQGMPTRRMRSGLRSVLHVCAGSFRIAGCTWGWQTTEGTIGTRGFRCRHADQMPEGCHRDRYSP